MGHARICIDTGPLIAFLKGRDPGAAAVERAVQESDICLEYGLPLLTLNERHFTRVPGLTVLTPAGIIAE